MMLVLLAAIDEGLASAFMGHPAQKRFLGELPGLPEEVVPIGLALIGKPGDAPLPGSRMKERRRADEALIHHNGWGGAAAGRGERGGGGRGGGGGGGGYLARTESTTAASRSAIAASSISRTFSAFFSPLRERLN